jgi:hypothetical protein
MAFIELPILGIDISKAKFDVALLVYGTLLVLKPYHSG